MITWWRRKSVGKKEMFYRLGLFSVLLECYKMLECGGHIIAIRALVKDPHTCTTCKAPAGFDAGQCGV